MRNKKLLISILIPCTILVPTVSAIAATSCSVKVVKIKEVENFEGFTIALLDDTIDVIRLVKNIGVPMPPDQSTTEAIMIGRSVTIDGNGGNKIFCYDDRIVSSSKSALFRIKMPNFNDDENITVTFKDVDIVLQSKSLCTSVVHIDDAQNSTVNFVNTKLTSLYESGGFNPYFALSIGPEIRQGCTVNITDSEFNGWGAIYNMGSNVKLCANNSTFVGKNYNSKQNEDDAYDFATITVSDYPMNEYTKHTGWYGYHSFSADNNFTFTNCNIKAKTASSELFDDSHQFIIQSRSPAHNIVNIDAATARLSNGINSGDNSAWYAFAWKEEADVTDANITNYREASDHADIPDSITNVNEYYTYYNKEDKKSFLLLEGQPMRTTMEHIHYYWINSELKWVEPTYK